MPKIKVNDIEMYHEVNGDGFPLVMIMGLSANLDWWHPEVIKKLSQQFKVLIFDNRGAGRTDRPRIEYSIKMFADDTIGLMDVLGFEKAHVLGVSMGGMIAQELILHYPERVQKLVLCATHCGGSKAISPAPEVLDLLTREREGITAEEVARETIHLLYPDDFISKNPDVIENSIRQFLKAPISADAFRRQIGAIMKYNVCRKLKMIIAPTLILHGKKDILVPPQNADLLEKKINGSKKILFDGAGHGFPTQLHEDYVRTVLDFLQA